MIRIKQIQNSLLVIWFPICPNTALWLCIVGTKKKKTDLWLIYAEIFLPLCDSLICISWSLFTKSVCFVSVILPQECYLYARHCEAAHATGWMVAWFIGTVESDLHSIFYTNPQWPKALCSSWNALLCDRCHIKQHSLCHQCVSKIPSLSLCSRLLLELLRICVWMCAPINQIGDGLQGSGCQSRSGCVCLHLNKGSPK